MKDADVFYQRLSSRMERRYMVDTSQTEKEQKRLEARNQEIDGMFLSLYTDEAKGILTEQRFMKLTAALEQEQEANQKRLHDLAMMQIVPMRKKAKSAPLSKKSGAILPLRNWTKRC